MRCAEIERAGARAKAVPETKVAPIISLSGGDCKWGRGDLNPGSPAPQAGILDHSRRI